MEEESKKERDRRIYEEKDIGNGKERKRQRERR